MFAHFNTKNKYRRKGRYRSRNSNLDVQMGYMQDETGFKCCHCHSYVSNAHILSGVNNRNHCPYCLWSRHLDLNKAGDRMSACKEGMEPIGLTIKKSYKKYIERKPGELMLIHNCTCGKSEINRIAADDDVELLFELFERSLELDPKVRDMLIESGIDIMEVDDVDFVYGRLFGCNDK
jgi:hypothetical protein